MEVRYFRVTVYPHGLVAKTHHFTSREDAVRSIELTYEQYGPGWSLHHDTSGDTLWVWDNEHPEAIDAHPAVYGMWISMNVKDRADHL